MRSHARRVFAAGAGLALLIACGRTPTAPTGTTQPTPNPVVYTLRLTLRQGQNLSGPYAGTVMGPNGFTCAIGQFDQAVVCPAATFAVGAAVPLVVKQTTVASDGNIFVSNTSGCDAITPAPNQAATCTVNMSADRTVVIGVGCAFFCSGLYDPVEAAERPRSEGE